MTRPVAEDALERGRAVVREVFGHADFRPGQEGPVAALIEGRDVLVLMPTGKGKSLCYQAAGLACGGLTLVVSPLLALMSNQLAALRSRGVAAAAVSSRLDKDGRAAAWRRARSGATRILYLAPETLMTHRTLERLKVLSVSLVAVDEAHCISQWGSAFCPEYDELGRLWEAFPGILPVVVDAFRHVVRGGHCVLGTALIEGIVEPLFIARLDILVEKLTRHTGLGPYLLRLEIIRPEAGVLKPLQVGIHD